MGDHIGSPVHLALQIPGMGDHRALQIPGMGDHIGSPVHLALQIPDVGYPQDVKKAFFGWFLGMKCNV